MSKALPEDEERRLAELDNLQIERLQPAFDRVSALAKTITRASFAAVGLVQADMLVRTGHDSAALMSLPREGTLADEILTTREALWIEDARLDKRFQDSPHVAGHPFIRFYAGAPILTSEGICLGAIYVYDMTPRAADEEVMSRLIDLAELVTHEC